MTYLQMLCSLYLKHIRHKLPVEIVMTTICTKQINSTRMCRKVDASQKQGASFCEEIWVVQTVKKKQSKCTRRIKSKKMIKIILSAQ